MKNTNVSDKSSELITTLNLHFKGSLNLARKKFIVLFISSLCKVQTVNFEKLANAFDSGSKAVSSLRRIQRFVSGFALESDLIAKLIFSLLPEKVKRALNFVIVGGGPTGVEVAGALAEIKNNILKKEYKEIDASMMQITLIDSGDRVLRAMSEVSSHRAERYLKNMGVKVCYSISQIPK